MNPAFPPPQPPHPPTPISSTPPIDRQRLPEMMRKPAFTPWTLSAKAEVCQVAARRRQ
jgi:hypothetical protein